jgi:hypothetical protein
MNSSSTKILHKLERLELEHLRTLCAQQREQLDEANYRAESAEFWSNHAMDLQEALGDENFFTHRAVGVTKAGELLVVKEAH